MKSLRLFILIGLVFGSFVLTSHATFSSIYIWGDSLSATATNNATGSTRNYYYGGTLRYSNGRSWVEVLAQRQGLGANSITNVNWAYSSNNLSYYGHSSSNLVADLKNFKMPANATNCLFVIWLNNSDFVGDMNSFGQAPNVTNQAAWTKAIKQHLTNHFTFITNLYAQGCRTLIAPNVADITTIPEFNNSGTAYCAFVRQQIVTFNVSYATMLQQICASNHDLSIYNPDIYSLLNNVLANAASFGLTNALSAGQPIDATESLANVAINGPGTNYIFWDELGDPTAAMSEVIADFVQQSLSPVQFSGLKQVNGSNRLDVANMPLGLNGYLDGSTNPVPGSWTLVTNFTGLTTAQSLYVPTPPLPANFGAGGSGGSGGSGGPPTPGSGGTGTGTNSTSSTNSLVNSAAQFYRLRFPYAWNWP